MCGISGVIGSSDVVATESALNAMVRAQAHRGPDGSVTWLRPQGSVALGHNRLKVIDLSAAAGQPMFSADGELAIVYNGEVYNYRELRRELAEFSFTTESDTEVLLAAYSRWRSARATSLRRSLR